MRQQAGFTYLGVLFLVALMGLAMASFGTVASMQRKREKESELLFVGHQFRRAIELYYEGSPGGGKRYPPNLEALLQDPRTPAVRRYLRRVWRDPVSGKPQWGLVEAPGGGVMGVFSLSGEQPVKRANFDTADVDFEGKAAYSDWKFVYTPQGDGERQLPASSLLR